MQKLGRQSPKKHLLQVQFKSLYEKKLFNFYLSMGKFSRQQDSFLIFSPENKFKHFMQTVSIGDKVHEIPTPVFLEN